MLFKVRYDRKFTPISEYRFDTSPFLSMFGSYSHKLGYTMASFINLNRPDVWTWETDQVVGLGTRAMAMLWSEGLSQEESKGIRKNGWADR